MYVYLLKQGKDPERLWGINIGCGMRCGQTLNQMSCLELRNLFNS